jgi:hypothetical protein
MVWAGHVARMGKGEKCKGLWCESPEKWDHLEDRGMGGRMELQWFFGG